MFSQVEICIDKVAVVPNKCLLLLLVLAFSGIYCELKKQCNIFFLDKVISLLCVLIFSILFEIVANIRFPSIKSKNQKGT